MLMARRLDFVREEEFGVSRNGRKEKAYLGPGRCGGLTEIPGKEGAARRFEFLVLGETLLETEDY